MIRFRTYAMPSSSVTTYMIWPICTPYRDARAVEVQDRTCAGDVSEVKRPVVVVLSERVRVKPGALVVNQRAAVGDSPVGRRHPRELGAGVLAFRSEARLGARARCDSILDRSMALDDGDAWSGREPEDVNRPRRLSITQAATFHTHDNRRKG
jgi:hypothetical protein